MATVPSITVLANKALIGAHGALVRAQVFTTNISDEAVAPGTTLKVPVYGVSAASAFNATDNNYGTGSADLTYADVTFTHVVQSFSFTDAQLTQAPAGIFANAGVAVGRSVSLAISNAIEGALADAKMGGTAVALVGTGDTLKAKLAEVVAGLENAPKSVLVASPELYGKIIALFDASVYGGQDAIRYGVLEGGVFGLKAIIKAKLPGTAAGAIVPEDALVVATRVVPVNSPSAYDEVGTETDENGFTIGFRRFCDPYTGANKVAAEAMIGAGIVQSAKVQKVTWSAS